MKDEFFAFPEDVLEIGTLGVHPKFQHLAQRVKTSRNLSCALQFAQIANVNEDDIFVIEQFYRVSRRDFFNLFPGVVDELLNADPNFLHHGMTERDHLTDRTLTRD